MTAFLDRIAFWRREQNATTKAAIADSYAGNFEPVTEEELEAYFRDFGPNVPVEDLGGKPCFYENGEPVYWEKAP